MENVINLETYKRVVEQELDNLRRENFSLKVYIAQLQENNNILEETLRTATKIKTTDKNVELSEIKERSI